MKHTALVGVLVAVAATGIRADDVAIDDLDRQVGLVILSTIYLEQRDDVPADDVLRSYKDPGAKAAYHFENRTGVPPWDVRLDLAAGDATSSGTPDGFSPLPDDVETGASVYFRTYPAARTPWAALLFRRRAEGTLLTMRVRLGDVSPEAALAAGLPRWRFFVAEAQRRGIVASDGLVVVALGGDRDGAVLAAGEVLRLVADAATQSEVGLEVRSPHRAAGPDEPYAVSFRLRDPVPSAMRVLDRTSGAPLVPLADGTLEVRGTKSAPARVMFRFGPNQDERTDSPLAAADRRLADRVLFQISCGRVRLDLGVERVDWFPVLTRFEVMQVHDSSRPPADPRPDLGRDDPGRVLLARRGFADMRRGLGSLLASWRALEPALAIRPTDVDPAFASDEPVVMGLLLDPNTGTSYLTAEDTGGNTAKVPGFIAGAHLDVCFDVWIVAPPRTPLAADGSLDLAASSDPLTEQRELRRRLSVEAFAIDVHAVDVEAGTNLRGRAGRSITPDEAPLFGRRPAGERLSGYAPLMDEDPIAPYRVPNGLRSRGTYEVRLRLSLQDEARRERSIAAAIRIRVVATTVDSVVRLQWNQERSGVR